MPVALLIASLFCQGCKTARPELSFAPPPITYTDAVNSAKLAASTAQKRPEKEISLVRFDVTEANDGDLPPPSVVGPGMPSELLAPPENRGAAQKIQLTDLWDSVRQHYPVLVNARLERSVADGKQLSKWGEFDTNLKAYNTNGPLGFYKTYRNGFSVNKPVFHNGGYVYSGYRIGDGSFQPWYKERETNESGELSVGAGVPLLKGRAIDERRAELGKAAAARQAVEPFVQLQLLEFVREATQVYWKWVAAGKTLEARRRILRLALQRVDQIEARIKAEDLAEIARINNNQLIASRQTKIIEAERKLQAAAIKLSLYWRDANGQPIIPDESQNPSVFPNAPQLNRSQLNNDIADAVAARPEIAELSFLTQQVQIDLAKANNSLLPKIDVILYASQDLGPRASKTGDKTPFELEAGFKGEVPLQRREARGKIQAARAKLSQIAVKRQFVVDKTTAMVQDAFSALLASSRRIEQAALTVKLANQTLEMGKAQFEADDVGVYILNLYEKDLVEAEIALIDAKLDFFSAWADYRAILAIDPY